MSTEVTDFHTEVIERSARIPVVVDFWAEWCGPCKVLGPVLERLAARDEGKWHLVKVDTDRNQDIAVQHGIRGIPSVKMFVDGTVVSEFTGALPEAMVDQWLRKALPDPQRSDVNTAARLVEQGRYDAAATLLDAILSADPGHAHARVLRALTLFPSDIARAASFVAGIEEDSDHFPMADAIRTAAELIGRSSSPGAFADHAVRETYRAGIADLAAHRYDAALEKFIAVIREHRYYDEDGARKACVAIFTILGDEHETTRRRRREFSSALY